MELGGEDAMNRVNQANSINQKGKLATSIVNQSYQIWVHFRALVQVPQMMLTPSDSWTLIFRIFCACLQEIDDLRPVES